MSSKKQSTNAVSVQGNEKIAQSYAAVTSGVITSVRVSVTYNGNSTLKPLVSVCALENGLPSTKVLGSVMVPQNSDLALSADVKFATPIEITSGTSYAIVVEYPDGLPGETFEWAAAPSSSTSPSCFVYTGNAWESAGKANRALEVNISTPISGMQSGLTSRGPVVSNGSK